MKEIDPDRFAHRKEALDWLVNSGYKVSQGKFYTDCNNGLKISCRMDGTLSKWDVLNYANTDLQIGAGSGAAFTSTLASEQLRKIKAEADMKEHQFRIAERRADKYWLHADDAWAMVAALIGTLRDSIRHHIDLNQREIVNIATGDQIRAEEVFDFVDGLIDAAFNEVAGNEINVQFEKLTEEEQAERMNE
jgi:hypothetical protein